MNGESDTNKNDNKNEEAIIKVVDPNSTSSIEVNNDEIRFSKTTQANFTRTDKNSEEHNKDFVVYDFYGRNPQVNKSVTGQPWSPPDRTWVQRFGMSYCNCKSIFNYLRQSSNYD